MKSVGKPDAGNRHVRFDERGEETERCRTAQVTAPLLDSTLAEGKGIKCRKINAGESKVFTTRLMLMGGLSGWWR